MSPVRAGGAPYSPPPRHANTQAAPACGRRGWAAGAGGRRVSLLRKPGFTGLSGDAILRLSGPTGAATRGCERPDAGGGDGVVVGRVLAWLLIAFGLGVFAYDLWAFLNRGVISMTALGQLWYSLHPGSLNLVQAVIERYVHTFLWDPIIISVLLAPAALLFLGIGILLALVFRKRKRRRGR